MADGVGTLRSRATGLALNFGIEPTSPHVSPRLSSDEEWAPVQTKAQLLAELQHIQGKIALLARNHNASISALYPYEDNLESRDACLSTGSSETLADIGDESYDYEEDEESMLLVNDKDLRREIQRLIRRQRIDNQVKPTLPEAIREVFKAICVFLNVLVTEHVIFCSMVVLSSSAMILLMPPFNRVYP